MEVLWLFCRFIAGVIIGFSVCASQCAGAGKEEVIIQRQTGVLSQTNGDVRFKPREAVERSAPLQTTINFGDVLRTLRDSSATVIFKNGQDLRLAEITRLEVVSQSEFTNQGVVKLREGSGRPALRILQGQIYFQGRGAPHSVSVETPTVKAFLKGTEFVAAFDPSSQQSSFTMFDGEIELNDGNESKLVRSGFQAIATPGQPVKIQSILEAKNIVQWWIYYPGILNTAELAFTPEEKTILEKSLESYNDGNIIAALRNLPNYPSVAEPRTDAHTVYFAALFLSIGKVDRAQDLLKKVPADDAGGNALRIMITAVQNGFTETRKALEAVSARQLSGSGAQGGKIEFKPGFQSSKALTASELLAISYAFQSTNGLKEALGAAQAATEICPNFGFAWARLAELEFSFGRTGDASRSNQRALRFAPRNAQALCLKGFLLAAENHTQEAIKWFNAAIEIDPGLGGSWLGRGLCERKLNAPISKRQKAENGPQPDWLSDLQTAAILEPRRSLYRSYLGKAFSELNESRMAMKELDYAKELDPNDPTPWLYSALEQWKENRVNAGVGNLERSIELNDNRALFRSRLLLDEDKAVRGANLAAIYRDLGMFEVSLKEASSAVVSDYANHSAHLFLANSYNSLRDPSLINLRYETATFSEYLVANLMSPAGTTPLSPYVSQQEYSRLFDRDRLGISSGTTYTTRGDRAQDASQYGTYGKFSYALDSFYKAQLGQRPNNDLEQLALSAQFKMEVTPQDSIYFQAIRSAFRSGDLRQFYDQTGNLTALPGPSFGLRVHELQEPNLLAGYHHTWQPGVHSLLLVGRLNDRLMLSEPSDAVQTVIRDENGVATNILSPNSVFSLDYHLNFDAYTAEFQQIFQVPNHVWILGSRYQTGEIGTKSALRRENIFPPIYGNSLLQETSGDLKRANGYGYYNWQMLEGLWMNAGVSYDWIHYPRNSDSPPLSVGDEHKEQVSPKLGFIFEPFTATTIRGVYTRSIGGLFYDTSVRLEPTQIAGFNQAFRSVIPESIQGPIAGAKFETFGLGLDERLRTRTYITVRAELLRSEANKRVGVFDFVPVFPQLATPSGLTQKIDYEEKDLSLTVNQLVGDEWAFGGQYRLSQAELESQFPGVSGSVIKSQRNSALLQEADFFGIYNHPCGVFCEPHVIWLFQKNFGYSPALEGDNFCEANFYAGYRSPTRHWEMVVGFLNLTGKNYRLNPLNLYAELPRDRTVALSVKFNF